MPNNRLWSFTFKDTKSNRILPKSEELKWDDGEPIRVWPIFFLVESQNVAFFKTSPFQKIQSYPLNTFILGLKHS